MTAQHPDIEQQLRSATLRTRRHWYADGLAETLIGLVFCVLALYFGGGEAARTALGPSPSLDLVLNLLFPALVIVVCLASRRLIRTAKERYVYPRTGFVRYPNRGAWPKWLSGLLAGAVSGLTVALIRTAPGLEAWIPAFEGFLIGGILFWQSRFAGVQRYSGLALVSALLGVLVSLGRFSPGNAGGLLFGSLGVVLLISGRLAFQRFLRNAPLPEQP